MNIYFDNSASTRVHPEVIAQMEKTMREDYANPSAHHIKGVIAERYIKDAANQIASTLKCEPREIVFTSGGTESNNMALIGTALSKRRRGMHIISSSIEHPAVYRVLEALAEFGFEITILPVDEKGHISLSDLKNAMREDTILVSIMYVNNEIGAIEPIAKIAEVIKSANKETYFHVDAIQAYGKYVIHPKKLGVDMLSVSGHKLHGPKGVGFLYVDKNVRIKPITFGGGQQRGMRSGTMNTTGIAGIGLAAKLAYTDFEEKIERMIAIKDYLIEELSAVDGVKINSFKGGESAPQIVSVSVLDVLSEVLLHALEDRGIYVSSGSACSSSHPGISGVLKGIGLAKEYQESTIRISLSEYNTMEEAKQFVEVFRDLLPMLRRFTRK